MAADTDRGTKITKESSMTIVHSRYSGLLAVVMSRELCNEFITRHLGAMSREAAELKIMVVCVFQNYFVCGPFSLELNLLEHLTTALEQLGSTLMFDNSLFDLYNVHIMEMYCQTTK